MRETVKLLLISTYGSEVFLFIFIDTFVLNQPPVVILFAPDLQFNITRKLYSILNKF